MTLQHTNDVVIIGGGVAGLAAGALMAKDDRRVTVLERGNRPGGRAYTYEEKGFTLNYGPHAMYLGHSGLLGDIFRRLERPEPSGGIPKPSRVFWADGDRWGAVSGALGILSTSALPTMGKVGLMRLFAAIQTANPDKLGDMTWGEWVDGHTKNVATRRWANALATVNSYTRPASALSAAFILRHFKRTLMAKDNVVYLSGGWRAFYDQFIDVIEGAGGSVVTGAQVERLEADASGRITAAITRDGTRYEAAAFVCALPPQDAHGIAPTGSPLGDELAPYASLRDVKALCIDLGLGKRYYDDLSLIFDVEHDLYYSLHSEVTAGLAPEGTTLLHAMAYLSDDEGNDAGLLAGRKRDLEAGLDRWFAGWRDDTIVERTLPVAVVTTVRRTPEQDAARMPLRAASASNLLFAGDARDLPYNIAEVSLASAIEVADAVGGVMVGAGRAAAVA